MTDETPPPTRRRRADAEANRARLLAAATAVFTERGSRASLNEVAKRAGVGPGTLYRHFPSLQALLVAVVGGSVEALVDRGRQLMTHADPDAALVLWLRAFAGHASRMQGLLAVQLSVEFGSGEGTALARSHAAIVSAAAELLQRSVREGGMAPGTDVLDLLRLVNAMAWASQQSADDPGLIDRLFRICFGDG